MIPSLSFTHNSQAYLAYPASSATVERVFSGAQRVISARRTRLVPESAEAQVMGSCNRRILKYLRTDYRTLTEAKKRSREDDGPALPSKKARVDAEEGNQ